MIISFSCELLVILCSTDFIFHLKFIFRVPGSVIWSPSLFFAFLPAQPSSSSRFLLSTLPQPFFAGIFCIVNSCMVRWLILFEIVQTVFSWLFGWNLFHYIQYLKEARVLPHPSCCRWRSKGKQHNTIGCGGNGTGSNVVYLSGGTSVR